MGKRLHVICPASGYPLDKITWTRGQHPGTKHSLTRRVAKLISHKNTNLGDTELRSGERLEVFTNGSLVISSVTSSDDGAYTCTATNRRGLSSSRLARLKVIGR